LLILFKVTIDKVEVLCHSVSHSVLKSQNDYVNVRSTLDCRTSMKVVGEKISLHDVLLAVQNIGLRTSASDSSRGLYFA